MARDPLILALANPEPGDPARGRARRCGPTRSSRTGRSDYPNQVNNVLCFPFIFRGALDVGATTINEAMKLAAVRAIAELAHAEQIRTSSRRPTAREDLRFGPRLPDPEAVRSAPDRDVAPAVAQAAMDSGVATRPIEDIAAYRERAVAVRLPLGHHHAAGVRRGQGGAEARRLCRRRGRARAARRAGRRRRRAGAADPARAPRGHRRSASERSACASSSGKDFELVNPDYDPRYHDDCDRRLLPARRARRRVARRRARRDAQPRPR